MIRFRSASEKSKEPCPRGDVRVAKVAGCFYIQGLDLAAERQDCRALGLGYGPTSM